VAIANKNQIVLSILQKFFAKVFIAIWQPIETQKSDVIIYLAEVF
jgi:hypothetical protein